MDGLSGFVQFFISIERQRFDQFFRPYQDHKRKIQNECIQYQ